MSAGTVFLNEMSSILNRRNLRQASISQSDRHDVHTQDAGLYPPAHDHHARREFGLKQLQENVYPFLEAMGRNRPGPGQLLRRLKKAVIEREVMIQEYTRKHPDRFDPPSGPSSVQTTQTRFQSEAPEGAIDDSTVGPAAHGLNMSDFALEAPGIAMQAPWSYFGEGHDNAALTPHQEDRSAAEDYDMQLSQ